MMCLRLIYKKSRHSQLELDELELDEELEEEEDDDDAAGTVLSILCARASLSLSNRCAKTRRLSIAWSSESASTEYPSVRFTRR